MTSLERKLAHFINNLDFKEVPSRTDLDWMDCEFLAEKILTFMTKEYDRQIDLALNQSW